MKRRVLIALLVCASSALAQTPPATTSPTQPPPSSQTAASPETKPNEPQTHAEGMQAYHAALDARRLSGNGPRRLDDVRELTADGEQLLAAGRVDEAIARMTALVEHPRFAPFAENEEGRAAIYTLGDALATAGVYEPARAYLRRLLQMKGAWDQAYAAYARRAVKRLVEIALESDTYDPILKDLEGVPQNAPEETRGDVMYLAGRAKEASGDAEGAIAAYAKVPQKSRYWAQATYLAGLAHVEKGRLKEGEDQFCKVADPKRSAQTTPVFADAKFFAVRDLARLGLGRVAHEQYRFDDSRYYYYLVPRDSDRLPEALYEAATGRYEKKDYDGARELLDELKSLQTHHPYEDEAWILDAYVDLAQCKFPDADKKLVRFVEIYEPVRDAARKVAADDRSVRQLAEAVRTGADAAAIEGIAGAKPEAMRAIAALVRLDPAYRSVARKLAVLDHQASGLRLTATQIGDLERALATSGGVRPSVAEGPSEEERIADMRAALDGVRRGIEELESMKAPSDQIEPLKKSLADLESRVKEASATAPSAGDTTPGASKDLPDLLRSDAAMATQLHPRIERARKELEDAAVLLARDALHRVDLRLSRLLRRARLGRIESVLGRKRALEVEIEAINNGILPADAIDSIDASRYLKDSEEYWPFQGDDWPDEFVGTEGLK
jgi:hypothetical protein